MEYPTLTYQVGVDYQHGANGAYLTYIGNVFLIPTVPFHSPFISKDRVSLNNAHGQKRNKDSKFCHGHFCYDSTKTLYAKALQSFIQADSMIWIDIAPADWNKFEALKIAKFGTNFDPTINSTDDERMNWPRSKSLVFDNNKKPPWVQDKSAFIFNWSAFFSKPTFYNELERLCDFLTIEFKVTDDLENIHSEFLDRHSFLENIN